MKRFIFLGWAVLASGLSAHPLDLAYLQATVEGNQVRASLDLNPEAAALLLGEQPEAAQSVLLFQARTDTLLGATLAKGMLQRGGSPCAWHGAKTERLPQAVRLEAQASCSSESSEIQWEFPFVGDTRLPATFQLMVKVQAGPFEHAFLIERGKELLQVRLGREKGWGDFVRMGIEHIGAAPSEWQGPGGWQWPEGIDHILFLIALVLCGGTFLQLAATVTGFTVGHSITLGLGAFSLVHLPERLVESAIALSIAWVAAQASFGRNPRHRWKLAMAFGLVHGLGFAGALSELGLSSASLWKALFGFNVGVELGQLAILALVAPGVVWLRKKPLGIAYAVPVCSMGIFIAGTYWFVERALGLG